MICPNCAYDLGSNKLIERDGFTISPGTDPIWQGRTAIRIPPAGRRIFYALASSSERMTSDVLAAAFQSHGFYNVVNVIICRMRAAFRALNVPCPIMTCRENGYRWQMPS